MKRNENATCGNCPYFKEHHHELVPVSGSTIKVLKGDELVRDGECRVDSDFSFKYKKDWCGEHPDFMVKECERCGETEKLFFIAQGPWEGIFCEACRMKMLKDHVSTDEVVEEMGKEEKKVESCEKCGKLEWVLESGICIDCWSEAIMSKEDPSQSASS